MTANDGHPFARPGRGAGRLLAGVCAGLGERWGIPSWGLRVGFVVGALPFGASLLLYAALALVMPSHGASAGRVARSAEVARTLLIALRGAGGLLVLLVAAGVGGLLALMSLGGVALLLASACVLALVLAPRLRPAPLAALAVALTLPAAAVTLGGQQIAPQFGDRTIELRTPSDVDPAGYRTGTGALLIDLRRFAAPRGSTTTIRARADLRSLVVALPRNRCFSLVVEQTLDRGWPADLLDRRRPATLHLGAPVRTPLPRERDLARAGLPPSLVAYGRPIMGQAVRWEQPAARRAPATLHLVLTTGRSQAIVRDYPENARPLEDPWWPWPRVLGWPRFGIPRGTTAEESVPNDPLVPGLLANLIAVEEQPRGATRGITDQTTLSMQYVWGRLAPARQRRLLRFVRQEILLRRATAEQTRYAQRFAGTCMQPAARRRLLVPVSSQQSIDAGTLLARRWAVVRERWPDDPRVASEGRLTKYLTDPVAIATGMR